MNSTSNRLFFIDAIRAWAILMMLQGHFIDGLLDPVFRDADNLAFSIWLYFRGITAPVFFTVSGFIFTYLLLQVPEQGLANPRVKKGLRRGLQLLLIGYALRLNLFGLLKGEVYDGFYLVDVLHCIGLSLLAIIGIYLISGTRKRFWFPLILVCTTLLLFLFEPLYKQWTFSFLPLGLANYFTKVNGSVFTIIPWLGYATLGASLSLVFLQFKKARFLYPSVITCFAILGAGLIYGSSPVFLKLYEMTDVMLFQLIYENNYLFIRLGDVFVVFALFMMIRKLLTHPYLLKIGANTLSIYVIHFIILYGSFTGLGLYKFLHHEMNPSWAISGAALFTFSCTYLSLLNAKYETTLKQHQAETLRFLQSRLLWNTKKMMFLAKELYIKLRIFVLRFLNVAKD
ncbi:MAG: heparan-alpha-glucosaminide N-acetyltransferase domain-containing protein [Croceivirga sp.]